MKNKGIVLVLATAVISGVSVFINKFGVAMGSSNVFTGLKNLIVGLFFLGLILGLSQLREFKELKKKDWLSLILIGLIGGSIPFVLFFQGLTMASATSASFIHKTMFLWVGLLAVWFLKEKLNKNLWIAILSILVGNVLLIKLQHINLNWGDGLIFMATLFWAAEITYAKKVLAQLSPKMVSFGRMFFGSLFILIFIFVTGDWRSIIGMSLAQWNWILITSAFLMGYVFTFYHGLKWVEASTATAVLALGAPVTSVLQLVFDGKIILNPQWWGIGFVLLGVIIYLAHEKKLAYENN